MNDDHLFGPKVDRESNGSWASSMASGQQRDENGEPKRLSVELPVELQGVDRPRKRSSWFSEMCLGKESKFNDMELHSHTPSSSSISGPADGKLAGRGGSRAGGGVGSRLRASIFSVLGKLGMSVCLSAAVFGWRTNVYERKNGKLLLLHHPHKPPNCVVCMFTFPPIHTLIIIILSSPVPFDYYSPMTTAQ